MTSTSRHVSSCREPASSVELGSRVDIDNDDVSKIDENLGWDHGAEVEEPLSWSEMLWTESCQIQHHIEGSTPAGLKALLTKI